MTSAAGRIQTGAATSAIRLVWKIWENMENDGKNDFGHDTHHFGLYVGLNLG